MNRRGAGFEPRRGWRALCWLPLVHTADAHDCALPFRVIKGYGVAGGGRGGRRDSHGMGQSACAPVRWDESGKACSAGWDWDVDEAGVERCRGGGAALPIGSSRRRVSQRIRAGKASSIDRMAGIKWRPGQGAGERTWGRSSAPEANPRLRPARRSGPSGPRARGPPSPPAAAGCAR